MGGGGGGLERTSHPNPLPGLLPLKPQRVCARQSPARGAWFCYSNLKRGGDFASVLELVGSLAGSASHPRVFWGEQKPFSPSKRNRLKRTVFLLSFAGNR